MRLWVRILALVVVVGAATAFAAANGGQFVRLDLGLVVITNVSVPMLVFGSVLVGMVAVLLAGLRADLRTRRRLQRYREALDRES
ncbi:MAG: hypothetical protein ACOC83_08580 [Gemmatimonadota bacterium]